MRSLFSSDISVIPFISETFRFNAMLNISPNFWSIIFILTEKKSSHRLHISSHSSKISRESIIKYNGDFLRTHKKINSNFVMNHLLKSIYSSVLFHRNPMFIFNRKIINLRFVYIMPVRIAISFWIVWFSVVVVVVVFPLFANKYAVNMHGRARHGTAPRWQRDGDREWTMKIKNKQMSQARSKSKIQTISRFFLSPTVYTATGSTPFVLTFTLRFDLWITVYLIRPILSGRAFAWVVNHQFIYWNDFFQSIYLQFFLLILSCNVNWCDFFHIYLIFYSPVHPGTRTTYTPSSGLHYFNHPSPTLEPQMWSTTNANNDEYDRPKSGALPDFGRLVSYPSNGRNYLNNYSSQVVSSFFQMLFVVFLSFKGLIAFDVFH